jgi:4-alpha-glucanotransferase
MKLHIYLKFSTLPGQQLKILGNIQALGGNIPDRAIYMQYVSNKCWKISVDVSSQSISNNKELSYYFMLEDKTGLINQDFGNHRSIEFSNLQNETCIIETWNDLGAIENTFYTTPFKRIFNHHTNEIIPEKKLTEHTRLIAVTPFLYDGEALGLIGNTAALGNWKVSKFLPMHFNGKHWYHDLSIDETSTSIEYKYIVADSDGNFLRYENGENRTLLYPNTVAKKMFVNDGYARLETHAWKGAGVAIPVFSLRTKMGLGVGEFNDIKMLVDWAKKVSLKMVQLLPVNDTTSNHNFLDSYPYAAISAFALHPLYINLEAIAGKKYMHLIESIVQQKEKLNELKAVDYDAVMKLKWNALEFLYDAMNKDVFKSKSYQEYFKQNVHWLKPYAAYCYLRDLNGAADPSKWGKYSTYNVELIAELENKEPAIKYEIEKYYFIQYQLHLQLKEAHDYANKQGIVLKGDIAIGVHRNGVDAWMAPALYHLDMQAGAPPDDFAVSGQNWGFPTYNWKTMRDDGFAWWKQRFMQMSYYFDAFRIDHILGFFRIWSIPAHAVEGIMGHFVPAIPVHRNEFENKGIFFETDRFCKPYINDAVIHQMAAGNETAIKHFLYYVDGSYIFKEEFNTQRKIDFYFATIKSTEQHDVLKQQLFNLHSNVILWKDENDHNAFHFRFNAADTISYAHLDNHLKHGLWELYVDYFFKRQDAIWKVEAMEKLPALKLATDMLICGEDLGLVPGCLPGVMKTLGFLSMEVQRMPKATNVNFFDPVNANYLTVVTPSTHDMSTIREWWEEDRGKSQQFYNDQLGQYGIAPHYAEPFIVRAVILQHLWSPAMWAVFQLQDLFGMDKHIRLENPAEERINVPGDSKHYWQYRMHVNIEDLIHEDEFNGELLEMIQKSGRG